MYLKQLKLVTRAARPSLMTSSTHPMSGVLLVNGAATDASASDNDNPTSAALSAAQSFAPSPHIRTVYPIDCSRSTTSFFSSGDIRAKIWHRASICVYCISDDVQIGGQGTYALQSLQRCVLDHPAEDFARDDKRIVLVIDHIGIYGVMRGRRQWLQVVVIQFPCRAVHG
jgi:hypothetical protein